jgi:pilus assembly protein CpaB
MLSPSLRFSVIAVLALAGIALGLFALNLNEPKVVVQATAPAAPQPLTLSMFVAAHPLPAGTLAREEDFVTRAVPAKDLPDGAIIDTPDARVSLRGSLVRTFLDTGTPVTAAHVLRPRDRGFLASVLEPGTRAISVAVDVESGVSGLVWPGDHVDVVLTHELDKSDSAHNTVSEVVLRDVRIIAIDQEIVQGAPANNASAGKVARTVTFQVTPDQVKTVTVGEHIGKLSLAMRSAVDGKPEVVTDGSTFSRDVSPAIAADHKMVVVEGGKATVYSFKTGR